MVGTVTTGACYYSSMSFDGSFNLGTLSGRSDGRGEPEAFVITILGSRGLPSPSDEARVAFRFPLFRGECCGEFFGLLLGEFLGDFLGDVFKILGDSGRFRLVELFFFCTGSAPTRGSSGPFSRRTSVGSGSTLTRR